jgi:hypothetical protein
MTTITALHLTVTYKISTVNIRDNKPLEPGNDGLTCDLEGNKLVADSSHMHNHASGRP